MKLNRKCARKRSGVEWRTAPRFGMQCSGAKCPVVSDVEERVNSFPQCVGFGIFRTIAGCVGFFNRCASLESRRKRWVYRMHLEFGPLMPQKEKIYFQKSRPIFEYISRMYIIVIRVNQTSYRGVMAYPRYIETCRNICMTFENRFVGIWTYFTTTVHAGKKRRKKITVKQKMFMIRENVVSRTK